MVREGIMIGPLFIRYYGILIMIGALAAAWLASREAKRRGINPEMAWDMFPWLLIGGIIGSRIWHILTPPESMVAQGITTMYYLTHPLDALAIWRGGLGIPGAVIGGAIALYFYARKNKISFLTWIDIIAPGLALAQAIGRWGNFINQEVYGAPTNLPWAIFIEPRYRLAGFETVEYYHPLFLYEFLINLFNAGLLLYLGRRYAGKLKPGDIFYVYLLIYPTARFALEFLRLDPSSISGLNANQLAMAALVIFASVMLYLHHGRNSEQPAEGTIEEEVQN